MIRGARHLRGRAALAAATLGAAACAAPVPQSILPVREARITGTVHVLGAEPLTSVVVRTATGDVRVEGAQTAMLERVAGATVEAVGDLDRDAGSIDVGTFVVKEVDGRPAVDGVLFRDAEGLGLVDHAGRTRRLPDAPRALRNLVGARVWITGPLDAPQAWGVILPVR